MRTTPATPTRHDRRAKPLALLAALLLAPLAAAGILLPTAGADPSAGHTWTCHADPALTGCPSGFQGSPGETVWFHFHGPVPPNTYRWVFVADSFVPTPLAWCVQRSTSGGGNGALTLQAGHVYSVYWGQERPGLCPLTPSLADRVPDAGISPFVMVPVDRLTGCVGDPGPVYEEDCVGDHGTQPGCWGLQRNDYDDHGRIRHVQYVDVCTGEGDAYVCSGEEWYFYSDDGTGASLDWSGFSDAYYNQVCGGVVDGCAAVWQEAGRIDPKTGKATDDRDRGWIVGPICPTVE